MGVTVAVTGPTGEIGISAVTALEREPAVDAVIGMARRPFDPSSRGWLKTTYQQGDILDRQAVDALVARADVVIHLAFIIMGSRDESARVNLQGTRNVFEATVAAERPRRLVYTSSVAAYGYHSDNPVPLTEDVPVRGPPSITTPHRRPRARRCSQTSRRIRRWRSSSCARVWSPGPTPPPSPTPCRGISCPARCAPLSRHSRPFRC